MKQFFKSFNSDCAKEVWAISIPAILESLFLIGANIIDSKMLANLGLGTISAISVTYQPRIFVFCVFFGMNIAVSAMIARAKGENNQRKANELMVTGFWCVVVLAIVLSILCVVFAYPIMEVCSGQKDTIDISVKYYQVTMGLMIFNLIFIYFNSALRGCGYTKITLTTNIVSAIVHIIFNYLLIGPMGTVGAALASVAGTIAALIVSAIKLNDKKMFVNLGYVFSEHVKPTKEAFKELFGLWKNVALENMISRIGFLLVSIMSARLGTFDHSIYSVSSTLLNINFAFGDGLKASSVALVGRATGERSIEKVKEYMQVIIRFGIVCALVLAVIFATLNRPYFSLYSSDLTFIEKGAVVAIIIAIICPIQIPQIILNGSLKCMDCSRQTLYVAIICVSILNPLCDYLLVYVFKFGLYGVMFGALITQLSELILLYRLYRKHLPILEKKFGGTND